jgi:hypothetical protein
VTPPLGCSQPDFPLHPGHAVEQQAVGIRCVDYVAMQKQVSRKTL